MRSFFWRLQMEPGPQMGFRGQMNAFPSSKPILKTWLFLGLTCVCVRFFWLHQNQFSQAFWGVCSIHFSWREMYKQGCPFRNTLFLLMYEHVSQIITSESGKCVRIWGEHAPLCTPLRGWGRPGWSPRCASPPSLARKLDLWWHIHISINSYHQVPSRPGPFTGFDTIMIGAATPVVGPKCEDLLCSYPALCRVKMDQNATIVRECWHG